MPKNVEVTYEDKWKLWSLYTRNDIIDIPYCPWCRCDLKYIKEESNEISKR